MKNQGERSAINTKEADLQKSKPGPGCSKLTTSLGNLSLKFQTKFCSAKASLIFFNKNIRVFDHKVMKHLTS